MKPVASILDARDTLSSIVHDDTLDENLGDNVDDRTIPVSRLDQMSRAPETVRSTAAPPRSSAAGQTAENNVNTGKLNIVDVLIDVNPFLFSYNINRFFFFAQTLDMPLP